MLSERLAKWQFWLLFIGFILTFGPMHISGLLGMPRRIYTYLPDRPWSNLESTEHDSGADSGAELFDFRDQHVLWSLKHGKPAGDDPWDAWTLEWATPLAAAVVQLRDGADRAQPPAAVGRETSGRSGLEV